MAPEARNNGKRLRNIVRVFALTVTKRLVLLNFL